MLGRLIRGLALGIVLAVVAYGVFMMADRLQGLSGDFIDRVGGAWGLAIIGVATVLLAVVWFRYGGTNALRRWGFVLKPLPPERTDGGSAGSGDGAVRKRPQRDPRTPTPR